MRKAISSLVAVATFTLSGCSPGESGDTSTSFGGTLTATETMGSLTSFSPSSDTTAGGGGDR